MIASLRGTVIAQDGSSLVIDVGGVGYLVQIAKPSEWSLNRDVFIQTSMVVREDAFVLFGFSTIEELQAFEVLRTVSGVGPKSALAILSKMSIGEIAHAVAVSDDSAFKSVSGIGPKTAKLICVSLSGKFASPQFKGTESAFPSAAIEVVDALVGLGWNEKIARESIERVVLASKESVSAGELLKQALATLGKSKSIGVSDE